MMDKNEYFDILGHDHDQFFVFQKEKRQIMSISARSLTSDVGFLLLAPLRWWETLSATEGDGSLGKIQKIPAQDAFIEIAYSRGIYDPSYIRGRGVWIDADRLVLHLGNQIIVDGVTPSNGDFKLPNFETEYVYELARKFPPLAEKSLSDADGAEIVRIAKLFRWTMPASAALAAGWVALAPLCGALNWKPHMWVTGGPGSGKSWFLNKFVHPLMNGMDIFAQGNSSEAGIRQTLRLDALPVLFDESEKNDEREKSRVDAIISLIRQASTESPARTLKGTISGDSMNFHIRSMFCLASIQVGLKHQADHERVSVLNLWGKRDNETQETRDQHWKELETSVTEFITDDKEIARKLFKRSIDNLPTTLKNIKTFGRAAAKKFGSQRDGDQYGSLMAGMYSLQSTEEISIEAAENILDSFDWTDYMEHVDVDDSTKFMQGIMSVIVPIGSGLQTSIHNLILLANFMPVSGIPDAIMGTTADELLKNHGIKISGNSLLFFYEYRPFVALAKTAGSDVGLRQVLRRYKGAGVTLNSSIGGTSPRAVPIPMQPFLDGYKKEKDDNEEAF